MPADKGWQRRFYEPIALPNGRKLVTLRDAGNHIASLPAKETGLPHWQTAARELIICAERGGILQLAEWAMLAAVNHGREQPPKPPRKKAAKRYRLVR
jgi:hypothetical protein